MRQLTFISALLTLLVFSNCGSDSALEKSIQQYAKDQEISAVEWQRITKLIQANSSKYTKEGLVVNGEIQNDKLKAYLNTMVGSTLTFNTVEEENTAGNTTNTSSAYSIFIENSASLDGYVKGLTAFKNTIYQFLSDIKSPLRNITDELNLYYVNSKAIPFQDNTKAFIEKLDPSSFRQRGGDRSQTDVSNILDTILSHTHQSAVNILITDGVFSPGKGKDPLEYLVSQSIGIKNVFEKQLTQNRDLTTAVVKLNSSFSGTYYDYKNKKHQLSQVNRPYYIWMMGNSKAMEKLLTTIDLKELNGMESVHYFSSKNKTPQYRVLFKKRIGELKRDRDDPLHTIQGAKKERRGEGAGYFQFAMAVDLSAFGLDESYLTNPANYRLNNTDYQLTVEAIPDQERRQDKTLEGATHYFILKTENIKNETLEIELLRTLPQWVEQSTSMDDSEPTGDETRKTFGLKYMVNGVAKAYEAANGGNAPFFNLKVNVKQ